MDQVGDDVVNLGILDIGAKPGWAVPSCIPEAQLSSIEDLKNEEVRDKLDGKTQGVDPNAGLMRLSNKVVDGDDDLNYDLDYSLISASGADLTAALDRTINRDEWILVTAGSPHWMFDANETGYQAAADSLMRDAGRVRRGAGCKNDGGAPLIRRTRNAFGPRGSHPARPFVRAAAASR